MLDAHTLRKTVNWLEARKVQVEKETPQVQTYKVAREAQIRIIQDLIHELAGKTHDIETAIEAGGEMGHLVPGKQTNTRHDYKCPVCGGKRSLIRTYFADSHVKILKKIFKYCIENKTNMIQTSKL